ncbi:hypothetical protein GWI33_006633 [Rhynchophorus ferrugineus]|uniref:Uncharacterized protein n=1 Tax=Rhynchophorus ferrugineus TaxID=354439 RepID=A0A834IEM9_RHYFE|nr:hypothetical protein GWI33_006633 [Rhynchophorus ferrugineus]
MWRQRNKTAGGQAEGPTRPPAPSPTNDNVQLPRRLAASQSPRGYLRVSAFRLLSPPSPPIVRSFVPVSPFFAIRVQDRSAKHAVRKSARGRRQDFLYVRRTAATGRVSVQFSTVPILSVGDLFLCLFA